MRLLHRLDDAPSFGGVNNESKWIAFVKKMSIQGGFGRDILLQHEKAFGLSKGSDEDRSRRLWRVYHTMLIPKLHCNENNDEILQEIHGNILLSFEVALQPLWGTLWSWIGYHESSHYRWLIAIKSKNIDIIDNYIDYYCHEMTLISKRQSQARATKAVATTVNESIEETSICNTYGYKYKNKTSTLDTNTLISGNLKQNQKNSDSSNNSNDDNLNLNGTVLGYNIWSLFDLTEIANISESGNGNANADVNVNADVDVDEEMIYASGSGYGANSNSIYSGGDYENVLHYFLHINFIHGIRLLTSTNTNTNTNTSASASGDARAMYVYQSDNMNQRNRWGYTPLLLASTYLQIVNIKYLLQLHTSVDVTTTISVTHINDNNNNNDELDKFTEKDKKIGKNILHFLFLRLSTKWSKQRKDSFHDGK
jgi:hypothetical protein